MDLLKKDIIFSDVNKLKGVGKQLSKYLKNRKIEKVKDILLNLPYSETDRSKIVNLNKLEVGKIQTIQVKVKKLNFPRIRNLPNKIICEDNTGKIEIPGIRCNDLLKKVIDIIIKITYKVNIIIFINVKWIKIMSQ